MYYYTLVVLSIFTLPMIYPETLFDAYVWYEKPFLYKDEESGKTAGMIYEIFEVGSTLCSYKFLPKYNEIIRYHQPFENMVEHKKSLTNELEILDQNIPKLYFPLKAEYNPFNESYRRSTKVHSFELLRSEGIAVILHQNEISLFSKITNGVEDSSQILILVFVNIIVCAVLFWAFEKEKNDKISESFMIGFIQSLWWVCVTLTTVGYGDITPITFSGRFIATLTMITALMLSTILTSTITASVTGTANLKISGREVAVIKDTFIAYTAKEHYDAIPILKESYIDIFKAIQDQKVFAGLVNTDYMSWNTKMLDDHSLAVAYIIDEPVRIELASINNNNDTTAYFECVFNSYNEVFSKPINNWRKKLITHSLNYDFKRAFQSSLLIQVVFGLAFFFIVLCLTYDFVKYIKRRNKNTGNLHNTTDNHLSMDDLPVTKQQSLSHLIPGIHLKVKEISNELLQLEKDIRISEKWNNGRYKTTFQ